MAKRKTSMSNLSDKSHCVSRFYDEFKNLCLGIDLCNIFFVS